MKKLEFCEISIKETQIQDLILSVGTGIAQKLLDKAEEFAWSRGETRIVLLTTYAQVAAIKLYKRNGYEVTKITPGRRPTIGFLPGILWRFVYMHKDRPTFSN